MPDICGLDRLSIAHIDTLVVWRDVRAQWRSGEVFQNEQVGSVVQPSLRYCAAGFTCVCLLCELPTLVPWQAGAGACCSRSSTFLRAQASAQPQSRILIRTCLFKSMHTIGGIRQHIRVDGSTRVNCMPAKHVRCLTRNEWTRPLRCHHEQ